MPLSTIINVTCSVPIVLQHTHRTTTCLNFLCSNPYDQALFTFFSPSVVLLVVPIQCFISLSFPLCFANPLAALDPFFPTFLFPSHPVTGQGIQLTVLFIKSFKPLKQQSLCVCVCVYVQQAYMCVRPPACNCLVVT